MRLDMERTVPEHYDRILLMLASYTFVACDVQQEPVTISL